MNKNTVGAAEWAEAFGCEVWTAATVRAEKHAWRRVSTPDRAHAFRSTFECIGCGKRVERAGWATPKRAGCVPVAKPENPANVLSAEDVVEFDFRDMGGAR